MPRNSAKDSLIYYETLPRTCNFVRLKNNLVGWVCMKNFAGARYLALRIRTQRALRT